MKPLKRKVDFSKNWHWVLTVSSIMMTGQKLYFGLVVRFLSEIGQDCLIREIKWQKHKNDLDRN
jgi:hypothetical protein